MRLTPLECELLSAAKRGPGSVCEAAVWATRWMVAELVGRSRPSLFPTVSTTVMTKVAALFTIALWLAACSRPQLPHGVPESAAWVEGSKTGYWQWCQMGADNSIRCTIWNAGGIVLLGESFRPMDGGPLPTSQDLAKLRTSGPGTGPYQICLSDGRILLPDSRFDELKAFIEGRQK